MRAALVLCTALALSGCGADKALHAGAGIGIGATGDAIGIDGCALAITAGVVKEIIDPVFSIPDVIATSIYCLEKLL